jgi:hypothetical protein
MYTISFPYLYKTSLMSHYVADFLSNEEIIEMQMSLHTTCLYSS